MKRCDLTLPTPEENLAFDEALLDGCEEGDGTEVLHFWEPREYFVVVGYANRAGTEVNLDYCEQHGIPVLRRCTGGGTVLQGPGVLNYSLVLKIEGSEAERGVTATNRFVMQRQRRALAEALQAPVEVQGYTDLAIGGLKFSGNAQRRKRRFLIFHGALLLHMDIDLIGRVLPMPSKQPDYRVSRSHADFLMNVRVPGQTLKEALAKAWDANEDFVEVPRERISQLIKDKYGSKDWNLKF